ncbi:4-hydroxythreonine-4-phosphate dehydrogenase PdxA [Pseudidiomarina taiwanensis]|uniref:4-hydroxythreonine-4-phosphate dehydrogenase n=1 Tax=Pseudidiomarina taiwanensis TaxID=337250 RepID=A0A432ZCE1_9GAMM|nr:4-hydroxythreonine-4-phosphate dehydrogenase PdxA [Pseudidiomarina taiwanensis]RUO75594.1 4-hydroxythreonine-4-phosphate dehydrogenase PdxA [Pseudidiomarina taiwanensis]
MVARIAFTAGEPAGIGPDLLVKLAQQDWPVQLIGLADRNVLLERATQLGLPLTISAYDPSQAAVPHQAQHLTVIDCPSATPVHPGRLDSLNSRAVVASLERAAQGALSGEFSAIVTGPVHKGVINEAGITFSGHTEFFAHISKTPRVVMMLATTGLRVALVTTHLPLRDVADAITPAAVTETIDIVASELQQRFGLQQPRILVTGLNPHAGEQGHLGREELEVITPAIEQAQRAGIAVTGPWPADTIFQPDYLRQADCVIAMYHDQGLPVLKYKGFGDAINITLGLPFIRTSVDHGTALDRAGTAEIHVGSAKLALQTAIEMSQV